MEATDSRRAKLCQSALRGDLGSIAGELVDDMIEDSQSIEVDHEQQQQQQLYQQQRRPSAGRVGRVHTHSLSATTPVVSSTSSSTSRSRQTPTRTTPQNRESPSQKKRRPSTSYQPSDGRYQVPSAAWEDLPGGFRASLFPIHLHSSSHSPRNKHRALKQRCVYVSCA